MKEVTLHQHEQARLQVLNSVLAEEITIGQAAELMDLSERHVRRLLGAYRELGAEALAHGNRGRGPHNAVPEVVAATVVRLAATRYPGANHTHLTELLEEHEGLALSRPTVRRILTRAGMPSPRRRRPPQHRVRRERMPRAGMLLQLDGSHHAWLEQRGPRFALLLAVDDATGAVVHALFGAVEDARGYFLLMEQVLRRSGVPLALYNDRHAVFRASAQQRAGGEASTQFARAMAELGVRLIFARSPQAKGRVERMAGTFQDRLVTELRLASATTIGEAQAVLERFLPRFNARFAVAARQPEPAWRPLDPALDLGAVLAFRHTRTVARDNTVKYHWRTLQLLPSPQRPSYAGARVEVLERPGGELAVRHQGETIPSRLAPPRSGVLRERRSELALDPALERVASGLGPSGGRTPTIPSRLAPPRSGVLRERRSELARDPALERALGLGPSGGPPRPQAHPATTNGTIVNAAAPTVLRSPTARQAARWKSTARLHRSRFNRPSCRDSRCAPPPGCSASHATPSGGTSAPAAHPGARVRHHLPSATSQTDIFAEPLSGRSR